MRASAYMAGYASGARSWLGSNTTTRSTHKISFLKEGRSVPVISMRTGEKENDLYSLVRTHAYHVRTRPYLCHLG
jgi:hypothetical protein